MNSLSLTSSVLPYPPISHSSNLSSSLQPLCKSCYRKYNNCRKLSSGSRLAPFSSPPLLRNRQNRIGAITPSNEGAVPVINFEDFVEKDWSFLETDDTNSDEEHKRKTERIISVAEIRETSKVLVSIGSEEFVDELVRSSPCQLLLVVHDSLLILACIKEKYDSVKCWQGELIYVPEKWTPFDVVFLYFLPALPFKLDQIFGALVRRCSPGARIVISHVGGRHALEQQRQQFPDIIITDLPNKATLESVASDHSFKMIEFIDEPGFYLAVMRFKELGKQLIQNFDP